MWLRLTAMTAAALLVAMTIGCDECDKAGEKWCEGNVRYGCYHRSNVMSDVFGADTKLIIVKRECEEVCVEYELQEWDPYYSSPDNTARAMCALDSAPCDYHDQRFCDGDLLKTCEHGYVVEEEYCPEGTECEYGHCL